jgi:enoyl-CoA hydratase/carnithine racemase
MKTYHNIELSQQQTVSTLRFNRPGLLNAMNREMMDEIIDALELIKANENTRVAVITGNGRSFMAGADIKEYATQTPGQFDSFQQKGRQLYSLIEQSAIPFIAAVNGFALGGGFEIALACDLIVAARSAKMGLPEVHLGLIPGGGGTQRLLQKTGMNRLKEMLLLGQSYPAEQLLEWGLVNMVCDDDVLMESVSALAEKLTRRPAQALKAIKSMLEPGAIEQSFSDRLDMEGNTVSALFYTPVAQQLIKKFVDKNN